MSWSFHDGDCCWRLHEEGPESLSLHLGVSPRVLFSQMQLVAFAGAQICVPLEAFFALVLLEKDSDFGEKRVSVDRFDDVVDCSV